MWNGSNMLSGSYPRTLCSIIFRTRSVHRVKFSAETELCMAACPAM